MGWGGGIFNLEHNHCSTFRCASASSSEVSSCVSRKRQYAVGFLRGRARWDVLGTTLASAVRPYLQRTALTADAYFQASEHTLLSTPRSSKRRRRPDCLSDIESE